MFERFLNWIKSLFAKKPVEPVVVAETPDMAGDRMARLLYDNVDNGSTREPDWDYIATNMKLDSDPGKLGTIGWYYKRYKHVEHEIKAAGEMAKCPWWFIAGIDMREMSFVHKGHFANGDEILGTGRKTYRIPRGLGPAQTWTESVKQWLEYKKLTDQKLMNLVNPQMNFGDACAAWEINNGLGFRSKGELSEYVCGFSNFHDETGRYVADGKYSYTSKVVRPGAASFVLYLVKVGDLTRKDLGLK